MKLIDYSPPGEQRNETEYADPNPDFQSDHLNENGRFPRTRSDDSTAPDKRIDDYLHVFAPGVDADHARENVDYLLEQIVGSEDNFARCPDLSQQTLKSIKPPHSLHEGRTIIDQTADEVFNQLSRALKKANAQHGYRCGIAVMHYEHLLDEVETQIIRSPEHTDHIKHVLNNADDRTWSVIPAVTYV